MIDRYLDRLQQEAWKSGHRRYKHAAALISKKGEIIAISANRDGIHAEIAAIRRWMNQNERHKRSMKIDYLISVRINKSGNFVNAKPCSSCDATLKKLGIVAVHT